jgi:DnaJ-class molecular chaperone
MKKYQEITRARKLLELPERATMEHIKANYRKLVTHWHPDKCKEPNEKCAEITAEIVAAYKVIIAYCNQYKFSFSKEEVKHHLSEEELLSERFGKDPLWGSRS